MRAPYRPGRSCLALALAAGVIALVAGPAQGAGSASVTGVTYDPPSGPLPGCVAPLPAGGGSASASFDEPTGSYDATWEWTVPQTITAGATARVKASIQVSTAGGAGVGIGLRAPFEFGTNVGARADVIAQVPVGAPGSATDEEGYTFTPNRDFTDGEKLYIRVGIPCVAFVYEYTGSAPAAAPTTPTGPAVPARPRTGVVPRTTRPVPGVVTSYAAPRKGRVVALPFPATGCNPPAATNARPTATPAGGECEVDIFLRRRAGDVIDDREATFGVDLRVSDENVDKAYHVCKILSISGPDDIVARGRTFAQCVLVVSRILQRNEDIRRRRAQTPSEVTAHAARGCRARTVRLAGARRGAPGVLTTCRRTAKGLRITLRPALTGTTVGGLIRPASKLLVGRSGSVPSRPGDRIDVIWRITPPRTTTTIRTPVLLGPPVSGAS